MGIFSNIRRAAKKAAAPSGTVLFRGKYVPLFTDYASLPEDLKTLWDMQVYYQRHDPKCSLEEFNRREAIAKEIVRKAYELVREKPENEQPMWVVEGYLEAFGTVEELDVFRLKKFCESVPELYVPVDAVSDHDHIAVKTSVTSTLSSYAKSYGYFAQHIPEIIHAVCVLVEKEKAGAKVYPGYSMYKDLMQYCKDRNPDKKFTVSVWKNTDDYLRAAYDYYDRMHLYQDSKKDADKVARMKKTMAEVAEPVTKEARINVQLCSETELLAAWTGTTESVAREIREHQEQLQQRKELADSGDAAAQTALAKDAYYGRNGIPKDTARAFLLFTKAEKTGNGEAAFYLGEFYQKGVGHIIKDEEKARKYYKKARRADYVPAIALAAEDAWSRGDRQNAVLQCKKVISLGDETAHALQIKRAIARLIFHYCGTDVNEHTMFLISLAFDYMRLDAEIVKKSVCDIRKLLDEVAGGSLAAVDHLEFYYDEYSHGPRAYGTVPASEIHQKDPMRAWEMKRIVSVLRLLKIAMLLEKVQKEPETYLHELATTYIQLKNISKAEELIQIGLKAKLPSMLYVAYYYRRELEYSHAYALNCLERAADMGYRKAIDMMDRLEQQEARTQEIRAAAMAEAKRQEQKTRADYAFDLEMIERQASLLMGGEGHSLDELALSGKISWTDAALLRHYKNKYLDRLDG